MRTRAGAIPAVVMGTENRTEVPVEFRAPVVEDAAELWRTVRDSGSLDVNSPYLYLLVCSDFADTSIVARDDSGLLGFVASYRPPADPDALFVWQVAVVERARGRGLGQQLLMAALGREANRTAREVTATVTPDNEASLALFRGLARRLGASCRERERFAAELFPADVATPHLPEVELRIGPLPPR